MTERIHARTREAKIDPDLQQEQDQFLAIIVYRTQKALGNYHPPVYGLKIIPENEAVHDHLDRITVDLTDIYEHVTPGVYNCLMDRYFEHPDMRLVWLDYDVTFEGPKIFFYRYDVEEDDWA